MDAFEEQSSQASLFQKSRLLYLFCVDLDYVFELTVPSLPFLKLSCLFGHASFPRSLSERRMVVFPRSNRLLEKLKDVVSPCVIEVVSSVEFQIHPDEIDEDKSVMLIWDFKMDNLSVTASRCLVKAKIPSSGVSDNSMPYLDVTKVRCNCDASSKLGKVLVTSTSTTCATGKAASDLQRLSLSEFQEQESHSEEEEEEEQIEVEESEDEEEIYHGLTGNTVNEEAELISSKSAPYDGINTLYTETYTLKGSSYHEHFQKTLKNCKEKLIKKDLVPVKLSLEPINIRDENAILVHACPGNSWLPIGYIPGKKVAKVTHAINDKEITSMNITSIRYQYVKPIDSFKYFAMVSISKEGRWMKDRESYKYNECI